MLPPKPFHWNMVNTTPSFLFLFFHLIFFTFDRQEEKDRREKQKRKRKNFYWKFQVYNKKENRGNKRKNTCSFFNYFFWILFLFCFSIRNIFFWILFLSFFPMSILFFFCFSILLFLFFLLKRKNFFTWKRVTSHSLLKNYFFSFVWCFFEVFFITSFADFNKFSTPFLISSFVQ